jgi:hypothetical protein
MRTIVLTEIQIKNVIDKILEEQVVTPAAPTKPIAQVKPIKQYNITNSFKSGQFQLTTTEQIDIAINEINSIVSKSPNVEYDVVVTSSESKVPNRGVGLKPGELSLKRGQSAVNYIKSKLGEKVTLQIKNLGPQGPEWDQTKGSDNPEYTKYQYVTIGLVVSGGESGAGNNICGLNINGEGKQGKPENNYVTTNVKLEGKGQLSIATGTIPDRMVISNSKNQITKDTGYVATAPHKYTTFKYVPLYVAQLTKLNGSPSVSGGQLVTIEAQGYDDIMKKILVDPTKVPTPEQLKGMGREVSEGAAMLKQMADAGTKTFVLYNIVSGGSLLNFDKAIDDSSVIVMSPVGQTGYQIVGKC